MKYIWILFLFISQASYAISDDVKLEYATKIHQGFILQSLGKSTVAFFTFQEGYMQAIKAGENPAKLQAILNHFMWYRYYGQGTRLFAIQPEGMDRIGGAPPVFSSNAEDMDTFQEIQRDVACYTPFLSIATPTLAVIPDYSRYSPPEIATLQTEFITGEGLVIAGLFLCVVTRTYAGLPLCAKGVEMIAKSAPKLYSDKKISQEMVKTLGQLQSAAELP